MAAGDRKGKSRGSWQSADFQTAETRVSQKEEVSRNEGKEDDPVSPHPHQDGYKNRWQRRLLASQQEDASLSSRLPVPTLAASSSSSCVHEVSSIPLPHPHFSKVSGSERRLSPLCTKALHQESLRTRNPGLHLIGILKAV